VKQQHASLLDLRDFDRSKFDVEEAGESEALLREQAAIGRNSGQVGLSFLVFAFFLILFG
jgi:Golgi SNAP receptor complex protein 1